MQAAWFLSSNLWLLPASIGKFYIFVVFRHVLMGFVASAMVSTLFRFPDISDCAWHSMHPTSFEGRSSCLICVTFCITTPNLHLYHLAPLRLVSGPSTSDFVRTQYNAFMVLRFHLDCTTLPSQILASSTRPNHPWARLCSRSRPRYLVAGSNLRVLA